MALMSSFPAGISMTQSAALPSHSSSSLYDDAVSASTDV